MQLHCFSAETYKKRRQDLKEAIGSGVLLFLGNNFSPMNYKDNYYEFRQDSCFLYFFGIPVAGLNAVIDVDNDVSIIFGDELTMDDIVWTGPLPTVREMAEMVGVSNTKSSAELKNFLSGRNVHYLPPYRDNHRIRLSNLLNISCLLYTSDAADD